jgi:hypothetical protein
MNELVKLDCKKTLNNVLTNKYKIDVLEQNKVNKFIKKSIKTLDKQIKR